MDLLKHHRIAIHHWEIIYSVEHHVEVEITSGRRGVTPLHRGGRGCDDGGEVVGEDCGDDDGHGGVPAPTEARGRAPLLLLP